MRARSLWPPRPKSVERREYGSGRGRESADNLVTVAGDFLRDARRAIEMRNMAMVLGDGGRVNAHGVGENFDDYARRWRCSRDDEECWR
jgi:hypothetical protein